MSARDLPFLDAAKKAGMLGDKPKVEYLRATEFGKRLRELDQLLTEALELLKELKDNHNNPPWHHVDTFLSKVEDKQ